MRVSLLSLLTFVWVWTLVGAASLPGLHALTTRDAFPVLNDKRFTLDELDAWKTKAAAYVHAVFEEAKQRYSGVGDELDRFKEGMHTLVDHAHEAKLLFEDYNADSQVLLGWLDEAGKGAVADLRKGFEKPLPEDVDERAKHRAEVVAKILSQVGVPYVDVAVKVGIPEEKARESFASISRTLEDALIVAGYIVDKHPELVSVVTTTAVFVLLPEGFILRPFLVLLGFGRTGPIKGSFAAWLQSRFWGGYIARGSWFAWMQKAGMSVGRPLASFGKAVGPFFGL